MSMITLDGHRLAEAALWVPEHGRWLLDVRADQPVVLAGAVTFATASATWRGTVVRSGQEHGAYHARVIGGGYGWQKSLPRRAYAFGTVKRSTVLGDAAKACGESVSLGSDSDLGTHYVRPAGPAMSVLAGLAWYIDAAGVTQVRSRPSGKVASPFDYLGGQLARGTMMVATDAPEDWLPARTFESPTVQRRVISAVRHSWRASEVRSEVWYLEAA